MAGIEEKRIPRKRAQMRGTLEELVAKRLKLAESSLPVKMADAAAADIPSSEPMELARTEAEKDREAPVHAPTAEITEEPVPMPMQESPQAAAILEQPTEVVQPSAAEAAEVTVENLEPEKEMEVLNSAEFLEDIPSSAQNEDQPMADQISGEAEVEGPLGKGDAGPSAAGAKKETSLSPMGKSFHSFRSSEMGFTPRITVPERVKAMFAQCRETVSHSFGELMKKPEPEKARTWALQTAAAMAPLTDSEVNPHLQAQHHLMEV